MAFKQFSFFLIWHPLVLAVNGMYECEINIGMKGNDIICCLGGRLNEGFFLTSNVT